MSIKKAVPLEKLDELAIKQFRAYLSKRRSIKTAMSYSKDIEIFLRDSGKNEIEMWEFEELALDWLQSNRGIRAATTTNRRLTSLRKFAQWAGHPGLKEFNSPVPMKSTPHPLPEGPEGIMRMIAHASNESHSALVALCGLLGCRMSEAREVRPNDFNFKEMILTVRGKGDKLREVPVSSKAWAVLASPVTRAFTRGNVPVVGISDRHARQVITDLGAKAGLKRPISSHDLRATFATAIYDATKDLRLVQELLGHSRSTTSEIYTLVQANKMREAVELIAVDEGE